MYANGSVGADDGSIVAVASMIVVVVVRTNLGKRWKCFYELASLDLPLY